MKKQEKIRGWFVQAGLLIAFACLQITICFPVFDFSKKEAAITTTPESLFSSDAWNYLQDYRSGTEENAKSESGTDTFSGNIFEVNYIEYPFFCFIKKWSNYRFDLYYPNHFELFSPPPESC